MSSSIITASYDKQVRFWDPNSGRTIRNFAFQDSQINALSLSPDRCRLAVAGYQVIRYYDVASSSQCPPPVSAFECSSAGNFTAIVHVPLANTTGALLFACSEDGTIRLLDPRPTPVIRLHREFPTGVALTCAALSADNTLLITGSQIGKVSVWHCPSLVSEAAASHVNTTSSTRPLQELSFAGDYTATRSVAISPLVTWVAVASNGGKVHCLQFRSVLPESEAAAFRRGKSSGSVHERSASDNPALLLQSSELEGGSMPSVNGSEGSAQALPIEAAAPATDGSSSSGKAAPSTTLSVPSGAAERLSSPVQPAPRSVQMLSPQQQQFQLEHVHSMTCHHKYILKCAISPDGKLLATCCADYTVGLWQVPLLLERPAESSRLASASPQHTDQQTKDGGGGLSPSWSEPTTPAPLAATAQAQRPLPVVPQTPEKGSPSVSAAREPLTYTFNPLKPLQGHSRWVWDCAFSPCSTALVTVSSDNHVRLWSSITDKPKSDVFVGHQKPVVCVLLDMERRRVES